MRRLGVAAARVMLALAPLLLFMAGVRLSGFDGEVVWQMPAIDVTVVLIDRDGAACPPESPPAPARAARRSTDA